MVWLPQRCGAKIASSVVGELFRRVSSSLIWARWFNLGCGISWPCQEAEKLVGPPFWGKPLLLCPGPVWGLRLHLLCHNFLPHNKGTCPLASPRLCNSHGPPKPVNTAPGTYMLQWPQWPPSQCLLQAKTCRVQCLA